MGTLKGVFEEARMLVLYQGWTLRLCTCAKARRTRRPQISDGVRVSCAHLKFVFRLQLSDGVRVSCAHLKFVFRLQLRCFVDPLKPPFAISALPSFDRRLRIIDRAPCDW